MKHRYIAAAIAMVLSGSAHAISPSQIECELAGGTFDRVQGVAICVMETEVNVGKSANSQTTTTTSTTSGQGNTGNKTENTSTCVGPGSSTSSSHCR